MPMAREGFEIQHIVLTREQLSRAKQRGDVGEVTEIPPNAQSLREFANAVRGERIKRNHEQPHGAQPIPSVPQIVEEVEEAIKNGSTPVAIDCSPQVLGVLTEQ